MSWSNARRTKFAKRKSKPNNLMILRPIDPVHKFLPVEWIVTHPTFTKPSPLDKEAQRQEIERIMERLKRNLGPDAKPLLLMDTGDESYILLEGHELYEAMRRTRKGAGVVEAWVFKVRRDDAKWVYLNPFESLWGAGEDMIGALRDETLPVRPDEEDEIEEGEEEDAA